MKGFNKLIDGKIPTDESRERSEAENLVPCDTGVFFTTNPLEVLRVASC